jgi:hypothetical protein
LLEEKKPATERKNERLFGGGYCRRRGNRIARVLGYHWSQHGWSRGNNGGGKDGITKERLASEKTGGRGWFFANFIP